MEIAKTSFLTTEPARKQSLEKRLGLEHSLFWSTTFRTLRAQGGLVGLIIVGGMLLLALLAPLITPYDPLEIHKGEQFIAPGAQYYFGTDECGRDLFSRTIYGSRISLLAGAAAVLGAVLIGVPLGLTAGYLGGRTDIILMRAMDTLLAFPALLLAMGIVSILGPNAFNAMIAVAIVSIPVFARVARASMLSQKAMDYVLAARASGATNVRIIFGSILPNALPVIIVQVAVSVAFAILVEASLSFLGLGTQPPNPSWGSMLLTSRRFLRDAWWYGFFPGLFLTVLILGLNFFSEALRDALDPGRRHLL